MSTDQPDKPSLEILAEFAKQTGRKIESTERAYPSSMMDRVIRHRRTFYIPNDSAENSYFAGFADGKKFGDLAIFCGVFTQVDLPIDTQLKIRKKDILDKLNPFLKRNAFITGDRMFDNQVIIEGDNNDAIQQFFKSKQVQSFVLRAFELKTLVYIGVNMLDVNFVPALKDKSHISIFIPGTWTFDQSIINDMFRLAEGLNKAITS